MNKSDDNMLLNVVYSDKHEPDKSEVMTPSSTKYKLWYYMQFYIIDMVDVLNYI